MAWSKRIQGDALRILTKLPDESVHCIVTSPPYWQLRDYGVRGQIGLEQSVEEYVENLVSVFRAARRVLKTDGTLWLNLGDSYVGSGKATGTSEVRQFGKAVRNNPSLARAATPVSVHLRSKNLAGVPWRVALALQADGWILRCDIIWHKPNCTPESVRDRPTRCHEYLFLLSKSKHYFYDTDAIREPHAPDSLRRTKYPHAASRAAGPRSHGDPLVSSRMCHPFGRNKRSVWTIPPANYRESHYAVFPERLVEPCILAGCPKSGTVLDPFVGSGTTTRVANRLGRNAIGIDIDPKT